MPENLYWNTVTPLLKDILHQLMDTDIFDEFRLVGGTSLSLQIGHRFSVDIDLFTDAEYDSIDFDAIDHYLRETFPYVTVPDAGPVGMGRSYFIGADRNNAIKIDLFYVDPFIQPELIIEHVRMATIEEIIAMKIDIIQRGGRKKDFWDLHELMDRYSIEEMIGLHKQRYPYNHDRDLIQVNFTLFENADDDFDPVCLKGKHWEFIKLDIY